VEKRPDNIAVVYEEQQLTYRRLNEKAALISRLIKEL
jgi:non-ribosomal peptide synthetase component F